jgi:hypothetical protein
MERKTFLGWMVVATGIVHKPKLELLVDTRHTPHSNTLLNHSKKYISTHSQIPSLQQQTWIVSTKSIYLYIPEKECYLHEGMLAWQRCLHFLVYNAGKMTMYWLMLHMVCESATGYICIMQIYDGKYGALADRVGFLLLPLDGKGYHVYQVN